MLQYCAIKLASLTLAFLPARVGYALSSLGGDAVYLLAPRLRRRVQDNLKRAIGPDPARLRWAARQVLRNLLKNYYEMVRTPHFKREYLERTLTVHGWEHFRQAQARGKGVILTTAHLGNYFFVAQILALRSIEATALVERVHPPALFHLVSGLRASRGLTLLPVDEGPFALREAVRLLRAGKVLALACDRDILGSGIAMNFLGERTTIPAGAVALAARTGAAILPCFAVRKQGERFSIYTEPPITFTRNGSSSEALGEQVGQVIAILEKYIRRYPEQWVVLQPVWPEVNDSTLGRESWNSQAA